MRCFSSLGWLGYSGFITRLTASPDFSQSATPYSLLVPRHPPHALNSLATLFPPSIPRPPHATTPFLETVAIRKHIVAGRNKAHLTITTNRPTKADGLDDNVLFLLRLASFYLNSTHVTPSFTQPAELTCVNPPCCDPLEVTQVLIATSCNQVVKDPSRSSRCLIGCNPYGKSQSDYSTQDRPVRAVSSTSQFSALTFRRC